MSRYSDILARGNAVAIEAAHLEVHVRAACGQFCECAEPELYYLGLFCGHCSERPPSDVLRKNARANSDGAIRGVVNFPDDLLDLIAERAAEIILERGAVSGDGDRWMDTRHAADYLGLTPNALHKLTASREIPFAQDVTGGKCWFLRSEIDAWRRRDAA